VASIVPKSKNHVKFTDLVQTRQDKTSYQKTWGGEKQEEPWQFKKMKKIILSF